MNAAPSLLSSSLRTLFSLIAVIGLIYFFMYVFLKLSPGRGKFSSGKNRIIEVIGKLNLSPKKAIYLVRVGKKVLVVGVNGGIYLLCTIEDEEIVKSLQLESGNSGLQGFSQVLRNIFSSGGGKINGLLFSRIKEIEEK